MPIIDTLAERLTFARKRAGVSKSELARKIYVSRATVTRWEYKKTTLSAEDAALVCKTLNISADWLLGLTEKDSAHE